MTPFQACVYCSSPADEIGRVNFTRDYTEVTYRCTNPRCQGITTAMVTLKHAGLPASGRYLHPETLPGRQVEFFKEQP